MAVTFTLDGIIGATENYNNSFEAVWVNGHKPGFSEYTDGSDKTVVSWAVDGDFV